MNNRVGVEVARLPDGTFKLGEDFSTHYEARAKPAKHAKNPTDGG